MSRALASGLFFFAAASCSFDASLPPGAVVLCRTDGDCGSGQHCALPEGFCVVAYGPAITLEASSVEPMLASVGREVRVSFSASRPVQGKPALVLAPASGAPFTPSYEATSSEDHRSWQLTFVPDGTEPQGYSSIAVSVLGDNGTRVNGALLGGVRFDFTAPAVAEGSAVQLEPAPNSPLPRLSRLGRGGSALVSFITSEPLAMPPVVSCDTSPPLTLVRVGESSAPWLYRLTLPSAPVAQGACRLVIEAVDLAGNHSLSQLPTPIVIDTEAPPAPRVDTPNLIKLTREPQGSASRPPRISVSGGAGAVEGEALVQAVVIAGTELVELARAGAAPEGYFGPIELGGLDRSVVTLRAVDGAGNVSPLAEVRDVTLVVRFDAHGPQSVFATPTSSEGLARPDLSLADPASLSALTVRGGASFRRIAHSGPPVHVNLACVTDWARGNVVGANELPNIITHSGTSWSVSRAGGAAVPEVRTRTSAAFHRKRGALVLFGGERRGRPTTLDDTWLYDGTSFREAPSTQRPPPRMEHAMAYDPVREVVVLAGGKDEGDRQRFDTWEWNGTWRQLSDAGIPPGGASWAMEFDEARGRMALLATFDDGGAGLYELHDTRWVLRGPAVWYSHHDGSRPQLFVMPETKALMAAGTRGGALTVQTQLPDAGWRQFWASSTSNPGLRGACYDPTQRAAVLIESEGVGDRRTWALSADGGARLLTIDREQDDKAIRHPARTGRALAYDPRRRAYISAGGFGAGLVDFGAETDVLSWDGKELRPLAPLPDTSLRVSDLRLTYDPGRDRVVALRCLGAPETNIATTAQAHALEPDGGWALIANNLPCRYHGFAVGLPDGGGVLYGTGSTHFLQVPPSVESGTWVLQRNGAVVPGPALSQATRLGVMAAASPASVLLTGGVWSNSAGTAWATNAQTWALGASSFTVWPTRGDVLEREAGAFWYDARRRTFLRYGGVQSVPQADRAWYVAASFADLTELKADGTWSRVDIGDPELDESPGMLAFMGSASDPSGGALLVGGDDRGLRTLTPSPSIWAVELSSNRPAVIGHAPLGEGVSGVINAVKVGGQVDALAQSPDGGVERNATVDLWVDGAWQPLGRSNAEQPFMLQLASPVSLERLTRDLGVVGVRVRPAGINGSDIATLRVGELWVELSYRRDP